MKTHLMKKQKLILILMLTKYTRYTQLTEYTVDTIHREVIPRSKMVSEPHPRTGRRRQKKSPHPQQTYPFITSVMFIVREPTQVTCPGFCTFQLKLLADSKLLMACSHG